jgi:hypothetical protein
MTRRPWNTSKDLRARVFGTAGRKEGADRNPGGAGEVAGSLEEILRWQNSPPRPVALLHRRTSPPAAISTKIGLE